METKSIERLNELHPLIRQDAISAYNEAVQATPKGVHPYIVQTDRSFKESDDLYQQGRTKPGQIVSFAKGGQSIHNYKLALDFCLQINGKFVWNENNPNWMIVVNCFKNRGFEWGGDWPGKKHDAPHLQKTLGFKWQTLLALHKQNKFIPGETYIDLA